MVDVDPPGGDGGIFIGADGDELHIAFELAGPDQVRHKDKGALQNPQEQRIFSRKPFIERAAQLRDAAFELLLRHQDLEKVLLHLAFHGCPPSLFSLI